jgi:pimeloyl-ACP methyl ester carboxylesterase
MSRPLVSLPPAAAKPIADRFHIEDSAKDIESFDLLAAGSRVEEALRTALARPAAVKALVLVAAAPPADASLGERFAALKIPTLVLLGAADAELAPETPRRWRALIPTCNVMLVYDAAHELATDRPEAFADVVTEFLSDPGSFLVNRRSGALQP